MKTGCQLLGFRFLKCAAGILPVPSRFAILFAFRFEKKYCLAGRNVVQQKPRNREENEFWHGLGIVIYVSKSMFFNRGVSKFIVLSRVKRFFEGTFGCGG